MAYLPDVRRVLVANEDGILRTFLERAMAVFKCAVTLRDGARGALTALEEASFDLLILDLQQSSAGAEVVREIRRRGHRAPILLMYGAQDPERETSFEVMDEVRFLRKPSDFPNSESRYPGC